MDVLTLTTMRQASKLGGSIHSQNDSPYFNSRYGKGKVFFRV